LKPAWELSTRIDKHWASLAYLRITNGVDRPVRIQSRLTKFYKKGLETLYRLVISYHQMTDSNSPGWKRGALIGLGALAIVLSILVLIHPGMTVVSIVYLAGIVLIIVGIEKIISGIFSRNKSRWGRSLQLDGLEEECTYRRQEMIRSIS
jgi:hypothetical protein